MSDNAYDKIRNMAPTETRKATVRLLERNCSKLKPPVEMSIYDVKGGDVFEIIDPPEYVIDPVTFQPTEKLQRFESPWLGAAWAQTPKDARD